MALVLPKEALRHCPHLEDTCCSLLHGKTRKTYDAHLSEKTRFTQND